MSLEVQLIQHEAYVEALVSGEYDLEVALNLLPLALKACKNAGLVKLLIDFRDIDGEIFAVQKIMYAHQGLAQIRDLFGAQSADLQLAFVGKAPQVNTYEPGKDIAEKEPIQVIVSADMADAMAWLGVEKTQE